MEYEKGSNDTFKNDQSEEMEYKFTSKLINLEFDLRSSLILQYTTGKLSKPATPDIINEFLTYRCLTFKCTRGGVLVEDYKIF